ncbi:MAG: four-carbon acid sugar kinase family protein [Verrucomicrobia bacterium]|nr:four-carbon acid sugar kinase family protein [Verrucomicrobiota bacterium]
MPVLGCIADDFTGGTDLANNLVKGGFRTVQTIGIPKPVTKLEEIDAVVVALKTRTCPVEQALRESKEALHWLESIGCRQFYFKYCSTFDSTPRGNIGPVIELLLREIGASFTIASPAFPDNGRTVYRGHLFVHDQLLNESGMQHHPLTPMTDPNIVRVLAAQTRLTVGLIRLDLVRQGEKAVSHAFDTREGQPGTVAITDATSNEDLVVLAGAARHLRLVTGGSGLAIGLGKNFGLQKGRAAKAIAPAGRRAILAGSCSRMTLKQIEAAKKVYPHFKVVPEELAAQFNATLERVLSWAKEHRSNPDPLLVYTSGSPDEVASNQKSLGANRAGDLCESFLAEVAENFVNEEIFQLIVAGGETSGAVVSKLGLDLLRIGPEIAAGVPWTLASGSDREIALALKSGNFGSEEFFVDAWRFLGSPK